MYKRLLFLSLSLVFIACKKQEERKMVRMPTELTTKEYKQSTLVMTLDHPLDSSKNNIYCATFPYAWAEIKKLVKDPIQVNASAKDLYLLNTSKAFERTLPDSSLYTETVIDENHIKVNAKFYKSLHFLAPLTIFEKPMPFQNKKVACFGADGKNHTMFDVCNILYYNNDNDFGISMSVLEEGHEILLFKCPQLKLKTLNEYCDTLLRKSIKNEADINNREMSWRYLIKKEDSLKIPMVDFSLMNTFKSIIGKSVVAVDKTLKIDTARQLVALSLNENGATLTSSAEIVTIDAAIRPNSNYRPKPKKLFFDGPFIIMFRKWDGHKSELRPYFAAYIQNTELMHEK